MTNLILGIIDVFLAGFCLDELITTQNDKTSYLIELIGIGLGGISNLLFYLHCLNQPLFALTSVVSLILVLDGCIRGFKQN